MTLSKFKTELRGVFNTIKEIEGVNIACVRWLDKPWLIIEKGEKWEEVSMREYTPILSFHSVEELYTAIYKSRFA